MSKRYLFAGLLASCLLWAVSISGQEAVTLVMRSGDRISAELVDLGGVGFTVRVNGQEQLIDPAQVAAVEFVGVEPTAAVKTQLQAGRSVVVLRTGEVIEGRLYDIGGTRPLQVILDTPSGQRIYSSNEVAQIYYPGAWADAMAETVQKIQAIEPGQIRVDARRAWTDTSIDVRRGERWVVDASGDIILAKGISAGVNGTLAHASDRYPVSDATGGTLVARIGNGQPFKIGSQGAVAMPADGRLWLGVNDDYYDDNDGFFSVGLEREAAGLRPRPRP